MSDRRRTRGSAGPALFDVGPAGDVWTGSTALVPWTPGKCPQCAGEGLETLTLGEPALFRHGGYGATRETVLELHACGYRREVRTTEVNPRW